MQRHNLVAILIAITPAQNRELDRLVKETKRPKTELIREAINVLIGTFHHGETSKEKTREKVVD